MHKVNKNEPAENDITIFKEEKLESWTIMQATQKALK